MGKMKKAQVGDSLKRSRTYVSGYPTTGGNKLMRADYSVDTTGYAAGKKKFPGKVTYSEMKKPSNSRTVEVDVPSRNVKRLISGKGPTGMVKKKRAGGKLKPNASNVSKKLGSAKKSIGNMRFTKKKK